jgi:hypothetical protein
MKTPEEIAAKVGASRPQQTPRTWADLRTYIAAGIQADREQIWAALREENPIITAWLGNHMSPDYDEDADVDDLWVQYIDNGDIGFDYTEAQAQQAKAYIVDGISRWDPPAKPDVVCSYCLYHGTIKRNPSRKHLDEKHGVQSYAVALDQAVLPSRRTS